jgi:hypothetical protein
MNRIVPAIRNRSREGHTHCAADEFTTDFGPEWVRLVKASAGIRQVYQRLRFAVGESTESMASVEAFFPTRCPASSEAGQKGKSTVYD